jgi:hypothetical protein
MPQHGGVNALAARLNIHLEKNVNELLGIVTRAYDYPRTHPNFLYSALIRKEQVLVAEARYVPNRQFLSIPFRSELVHYTV